MGMSEWVRFTLLISADAIRQAEAAQRNYAAEAPRRAHAVTCKCLTCKPEGGKR